MKKIPFIFVVLSLALAACSTLPLPKQAEVKAAINQVATFKPAYNVNDYYQANQAILRPQIIE